MYQLGSWQKQMAYSDWKFEERLIKDLFINVWASFRKATRNGAVPRASNTWMVTLTLDLKDQGQSTTWRGMDGLMAALAFNGGTQPTHSDLAGGRMGIYIPLHSPPALQLACQRLSLTKSSQKP